MVRLKVMLNSSANNYSNLSRHFCQRNEVILIEFIESKSIHHSILITKGNVAKIFTITFEVFMPDKYLSYVHKCFSLLEAELYAQELNDCFIFCFQVFTKLHNVGLGSESGFQIFASPDVL